jgi:hypothetical protein
MWFDPALIFGITFAIAIVVAFLVCLWIGAMASAFGGDGLSASDVAFLVLVAFGVAFVFASISTSLWWLVALAVRLVT